MNYRRPLMLDILPWFHALLLFAGIYPFLASLVLFKGAAFWRITCSSILLIIPIILSWLLVQRIRNIILFSACGMFISAAAALISYYTGGFEQTSGTVCAVVTLLCSLIIFGVRAYTKAVYGRMKQDFYEVHKPEVPFEVQEREIPSIMNRPQAYHWVWLTILYVPGMLLHFTTCLYLLFGILFVDIFICLSFHYISALYEYVRENQHVASLPVATMSKIHRMTGIIGALLLFLFLLPALLYGREFEPDLTTDKPILTFDEVIQEMPPEAGTKDNSVDQMREALDVQVQDTPEWILSLARILGYLIGTAIIAGIIFSIIRGIRRFGKDFAVEAEEDEVVFLEPDHNGNTALFFSRAKREGSLSVNQKIRRRYRKTIRKATKGQPNKWATPSELERDAALTNTAGMQALHDAYEKARYSEKGCTREDINLI